MKDREPWPNMSGFKLNKGWGIHVHAEIFKKVECDKGQPLK